MTSAALRPVAPGVAADIVAELPALRGFARGLLRGGAGQDDLVQETVCKALAGIRTFRPGTSLSAWLYVIMRNELVAVWRKRRRETQDPDGSYSLKRGYVAPQEAEILFRETASAFGRLTPDHRSALMLVPIGGLQYADAAALEGVAIRTIKSRVHRARVALAEAIGPG